MIFDLKYHIASLAAIFLALGIGVLVGTTMAGNDFFLSREEQLIRDIQAQISSQQEENRRAALALTVMQQDSAFQKQFNRSVLPILVQNKLRGRAVAIVDTAYQKEHEELAEALKAAGAVVRSTTVVNLGLLTNAETSSRVAAYFGEEEGVQPEKYLPDLARSLASAVAAGGASDLADSLRQLGIIRVSGDLGAPLQDIIAIGGCSSKETDFAPYLDLVMIDLWRSGGLAVYGVEDSTAPVSYMRYYEKAGITSIDDIDTIYGQVALVGAMAGHPGHYGIKRTAESFMPPLLGD